MRSSIALGFMLLIGTVAVAQAPPTITLNDTSQGATSLKFFQDTSVLRSEVTSNNSGVATGTTLANAFKLWHHANGPMAFATNNTEWMRVRADGKVVINSTEQQGGTNPRFSIFEGQTNASAFASVLWLTQNVADANAASRASVNAAYSAGEHAGSLVGMTDSATARGSGTLANAIGNIIQVQATDSATVTRAFGAQIAIFGTTNSVTTGYGLYVEDVPSATAYGIYANGGNDRNYFAGTVGIGAGTTSPAATLHVKGSTTAAQIEAGSGIGQVKFSDTHATEGYGDGVLMQMTGNSLIRVSNLQIGSTGTPSIVSIGAPLVLNQNQSSPQDVIVGQSTYATRLRVEGTGVSTFGGSVTVAGDMTVNGNIAAKYQDLAEWVPSIERLEPGTVVVLDTGRPNHVLPSSHPYDTAVAGVVSAQPGIALGEAGDSKALIATTGRVHVRVDATRHPIAIGDLLVTGNKPGVAMKSIPLDIQGMTLHRPGTVVGKALEALPAGEGEILVLLSLQ